MMNPEAACIDPSFGPGGLSATPTVPASDAGEAAFQRIRALFDAVGVPGPAAVRLLQAMAGAILLSKASTPLPPHLYPAFDLLGFPARLTRPAVQRVGASERDVSRWG